MQPPKKKRVKTEMCWESADWGQYRFHITYRANPPIRTARGFSSHVECGICSFKVTLRPLDVRLRASNLHGPEYRLIRYSKQSLRRTPRTAS